MPDQPQQNPNIQPPYYYEEDTTQINIMNLIGETNGTFILSLVYFDNLILQSGSFTAEIYSHSFHITFGYDLGMWDGYFMYGTNLFIVSEEYPNIGLVTNKDFCSGRLIFHISGDFDGN